LAGVYGKIRKNKNYNWKTDLLFADYFVYSLRTKNQIATNGGTIMNAEFTVSIGLNDQFTHTQLVGTEKAKHMVFEAFGDCTIQVCSGRFTHANGVVVDEVSFRVYIYADHTEKARLADICRKLKTELNQECIVLSWRPCGETDFI
jgi:hypothetical protein